MAGRAPHGCFVGWGCAPANRQSQLAGIAIWRKLQGPERAGEGAISANISCLWNTGKIADVREFSRFAVEKLIPTFPHPHIIHDVNTPRDLV